MRLLLAAVLAALMPGDGASQQLGSLRSAVSARIEADGSLIWSPNRPLVRADFAGPVSGDDDRFAATTVSAVLHAIACDQAHVEYVIYAVFSPTASWTLPEALLNTPLGAHQLAHEQGHFDITEIAARRFRAELQKFSVPCDSATAVFERMAAATDAWILAKQTQYDKETNHSLKKAEQQRWLAWIKATLDSIPAGEPWNSRKYWKP